MLENILLIGTSHISSDSINEIKLNFFNFKPTIIAVELDNNRMFALEHPETQQKNINIFKTIKDVGLTGFIFLIVGKALQKKLGNIVNLQPGSDMLIATKLAKQNNLKLFLIDRPIQITLKRFSKEFKFKEKLTIIKDVFLGIFSKKQRIKFDIKSVPKDELIEELLKQTKLKYPSLYKVLIEERNHYMAKKLIHIHKKFPNERILVVVGAGHKQEMYELLKYYNNKIEIIHS